MRLSLIPLLLLVIPVLEITVFILVGGQIGIVATLAMILVTAIIGTILLRVQGFQIITNIQSATERGEIPGKDLGHGAMILVAGVLLLTPGFVTDSIGFLLFVPQVRSAIWRFLRSRIHIITPQSGGFGGGAGTGDRNGRDGVVDLDPDEFSHVDDPSPDTAHGNDGDGEGRITDAGHQTGNRKSSPWQNSND